MATDDTNKEGGTGTANTGSTSTESTTSNESNTEDHEASWTRMDAMVRKAVAEELGKWSPPAANKNSTGSEKKESSDSNRKKETPRGFLGKWF